PSLLIFQDWARSLTRPVPVGFGWSSLLYRFWSIQIDSFTEFDAGSRVSTLTALAMTRVLLPAAEPDDVPPVFPPLEQPAAAMESATTARPSGRRRRVRRERNRGQVARSMVHPTSSIVDRVSLM